MLVVWFGFVAFILLMLALDLGVGSKANALFAKVLVPNWRSLVAEDCARLHIEGANATSPAKATAIFYLDPGPK